MAILTGKKGELTLHFSFDLHSSDNEQYEHFPCVCWHLLSSLKKCLFRSSTHFFIFFKILSQGMSCLYILELIFLSAALFVNISSILSCPFHLVYDFLVVQKLLQV